MATIGRMAVDLVTTTAQFTSGLRMAERSTEAFARGGRRASDTARRAFSDLGANAAAAQMQGLEKRADGLGASMMTMATNFRGVIGAMGIGAALSQVRRLMEEETASVEAMDNLSKGTGLAVQQIAALEMEAGAAGLSIEAISSGLEKMTASLGKMDRGGLAADSMMRRLGLSAQDLKQASPWETLKKTADAMQKMTVAQRAMAARELFGKGGMEMLPLLQNGSAGLEAMVQEAQKLGYAPDNKSLDRIREADAAMDDFSKSWKGMRREIAIAIGPTVARDFATVTNSLKLARDLANENILSWEGFYAVASDVRDIVHFERPGKTSDTKAPYGDGRVSFDEMERGQRVMEEMKLPAERYRDRVREINEMAELGTISHETWARALRQALRTLEQEDPVMRAAIERRREGKALTESMKTPAERYAATQKHLNELLKKNAIDQETYNRALANARKEYEAQDPVLRRRAEYLEKGRQVKSEMRNPAEIYRDRINELSDLAATGSIDKETWARGMRRAAQDFRSTDPQSVKAEEERRRQQEASAGWRDRIQTPRERYAQSVRELNGLLKQGYLGQGDYNRALAAARKELEETDEQLRRVKERQEEMRLAGLRTWEETRTPLEKLNSEFDKYNKQLAAGAINQETWRRAVRSAGQDYYRASGLEDQVEQMKRNRQALEREGQSVWEQTRTPQERFGNEVDRLNELLRQGVIDADTYGRAWRQAASDYQDSTRRMASASRQMEGSGETLEGKAIRWGRRMPSGGGDVSGLNSPYFHAFGAPIPYRGTNKYMVNGMALGGDMQIPMRQIPMIGGGYGGGPSMAPGMSEEARQTSLLQRIAELLERRDRWGGGVEAVLG